MITLNKYYYQDNKIPNIGKYFFNFHRLSYSKYLEIFHLI